MAQVGENNEPLKEVAAYANYEGVWSPMLIDQNGYLMVRLPYTEDIEARGYGWINGGWQRSPIPFGASGSKALAWSDTNLPAGVSTITSSSVPSGEIWVITHVGMRYGGTSPTYIRFGVTLSSQQATFWQVSTPTSVFQYDNAMRVIMFEGDLLFVTVAGATAGDNLFGSAIGYRLDIDQ